MKSFLKFLLIFFLILVLSMGGLIIIFISSSTVQRATITWALETLTPMEVEMEHLKAGFSGMEIRGLNIQSGQESIQLESMKAAYSFGRLTGDPKFVESVKVTGLVVDLRATGGIDFSKGIETQPNGKGPSKSPPESGAISLPIGIGEFTFDGLILLPDDQSFFVDATLKDLQNGKTASFSSNLKTSSKGLDTQLPPIHLSASGEIELSANSELEYFVLSLEADEFDLDAWQPLFTSTATTEEPETRDSTPDTSPPWMGLAGEITAKLAVFKTSGNIIRDVSAKIKIPKEGPLEIEASAISNDSPLQASMQLAFQETDPESPYLLTGTVNLDGLDVTPFMKTSPNDPTPILEGIFDLSGRFQSTAPNLGLIAEKLNGEASLKAVGAGVFRPLGENTAMATGVSGLLGALSGSVRELGWIREVIDQLAEVPYSQMTFSVAREPSLDIVLRELDLISRDTRIRGEGTIYHEQDVPFFNYPIDMKFQLFAKGRLAEALKAGRQLKSREPDSLGFMPGPPLPLRGTIAEPESLIQNMLMDSTQQLIPGLFGN